MVSDYHQAARGSASQNSIASYVLPARSLRRWSARLDRQPSARPLFQFRSWIRETLFRILTLYGNRVLDWQVKRRWLTLARVNLAPRQSDRSRENLQSHPSLELERIPSVLSTPRSSDPSNRGRAEWRLAMTMAMMGMAIVRVLAVGLVMRM